MAAIVTENLTKFYGRHAACAGINIVVAEGEVFGFLGPNGAGKSTLVKTLVGLLRPSSGRAWLLGRLLGDVAVRRRIGYLPENFRYHDWLTGAELLSVHGALCGLSPGEGLGGLLVLYACLFFGTVVGIVHYYTGLGVAGPLPALGFFCLIPVVLLAVTVLGSTVLPTLANGIAVFALYVVGFIGGTVEQLGALIDNAVMVRIGIVSGLLMPADALYRKMVAVLTAATADPLAAVRQMGPLGSLSEPSLWMLVYTLLYACAALALAVRVFNRRDL